MKVGNKSYVKPADVPDTIPIFPLSGALLLPGGNLPLNIFEPRYLAMIDDALTGHRIIGMIQPDLTGKQADNGPALCSMGCAGRLTGFQETGDGRYLINLTGICRFEVIAETKMENGYRRARISVDGSELMQTDDAVACENSEIDRDMLLETLRRYLEANDLNTDWKAVEEADNETLVTALCMLSPYGPAEKQALLEAKDTKTRAETLVAITEIALAKDSDDPGRILQ